MLRLASAVLVCVLGAALVVFTAEPSRERTSSAQLAMPEASARATDATGSAVLHDSAIARTTPPPTACSPEPELQPDPEAATAALGTALVRRGSEYRLVSLDHPERSRKVASCTGRAAVGAAYVGVAGSHEATQFYFATHQAEPDAVTEVYRVRLIGGTPERLLVYTGRVDEVAISPDGKAVAYVNRTGLRVRDLTTQDDRLLQRHELFCPTSHRDCYMNSAPVWSSDGRYIAYFEYHGEAGGTTQLIEPAVAPASKVEVVTGGLTPIAWSPAGATLCGLGGFGPFDGAFFEIPTGRARPLAIPGVATGDPAPTFGMTSCTWARDGRVAVSYAPRVARAPQGEPFVALLSRDLQLEHRVQTAGVPQAWTADGRAVVLADYRAQEAAHYSLLYTDGSIVPLDLDADALLAVITGR